MDGRRILSLACAALFLGAVPARAAVVELSTMYAYSKSEFEDYKSSQQRVTGSIEIKFTQVSSIQFEYTDSRSEFHSMTDIGTNLVMLSPQITSYKDKIYSVNWVQNLVPAKWIIQPYVVVGGGKVDRKITQSMPDLGRTASARQNSVTGTAGVGLRIFLLQNMALKTEFKSYVPDFRFSKWKENQMLSVGLSWLF